jgi:hypothetical protein
MVDESDAGVGDLNRATAVGVESGAAAALRFATGRARTLPARAVAGSANNLLASPEAGEILFARGIAYAPDFLVNAGALIQGIRFLWKGERSSDPALGAIGDRTHSLLERSRDRGIPPETLLSEETLERLRSDRRSKHWFIPRRSTDSP